MDRRSFLAAALGGAFGGVLSLPQHAFGETSTVRISHGYGILYLPLMVMRDQQLLEKQAKADGLGDIKVSWIDIDGGNVINDAMLAGSLDIAGTGAPGFITLWSKARGIPRSEIIGLGALSTSALWMNTTDPKITSLADFTSRDKIALPGVKTSLSAVVLEMAVAKVFGIQNYAKLDPLTVGLSHPDAMAALLSGKTDITAHFTSPPFSYQELEDPRVHRVFSSAEILGNITLDVVYSLKQFVDRNPQLIRAFMTAQNQANAYIAANRVGAAETFLRISKIDTPKSLVEKILADPDTRFSTTPNGVMKYVDFMSRAGLINNFPRKWTDMFVSELSHRTGS
ncbi:nitrate/sulfonate/bicarbonate ABC transporter periplasmic protein [Pandoraea thiooxydans]|uniref:Nitrate ABC transporter substrate-binding protein n=1 Tax=Pandoraea thiooxydans TaxID=445709 RepID=A0A0G3ETX0_9BURK|nr:nitrate ABC transporter substrate-binding protein [Pandoraea thiooxydans]APR97112.1 nitrate/sulfonate/bicarbonate ABC transporter periplasmic protein [Pandoraea thiooxydans]